MTKRGLRYNRRLYLQYPKSDVDDSDEFNESTHTCEICGKPATESLRGSSNEFIRTAIEQFGCSQDGYVCLDCCDKIGDEVDSEYGTGFEGVDFYEES